MHRHSPEYILAQNADLITHSFTSRHSRNGQKFPGDPEALAPNKTTLRFAPVAIDDIKIAAEPAWAIHRLLPSRGLVCVVGPPKCGKSFFTSDMLLSVARGVPYAGRETLQGPVIYLTGEGVSGFKRRMVGMRQHYGIEGQGVPFYMIGNVPDLGSESTDLAQLLAELDAFIQATGSGAPRAIALDTVARCMGSGDENSARDMGRLINRCGIIERHYGSLVAAIHHMGKDASKGGRGSNTLNGAADVTMIIEKGEAQSSVRIDEMKDGPEGQEWKFRLIPYDISETSEDPSETKNETMTCVVELLSDPSSPKPKTKPSAKPVRGVAGDLLKVIRRAIDEAGKINPDSTAVPNNVRAISKEDLKRYCATMGWQEPDEKPDSFRTMLNKTLSSLRASEHIDMDKRWIWSATS